MAWSPLSIIDAIDASATIQRARRRQEVESMPAAREIGQGAKGGGGVGLGVILFGVIALIGVVVVGIAIVATVAGG